MLGGEGLKSFIFLVVAARLKDLSVRIARRKASFLKGEEYNKTYEGKKSQLMNILRFLLTLHRINPGCFSILIESLCTNIVTVSICLYLYFFVNNFDIR